VLTRQWFLIRPAGTIPMLLTFILFFVSAAAIYLACEYFVNGIEWFGKHLNLGATAVGSVLAAFGTDINPSRLILEVTENIALNNCASMIEKMNFLSRHGIQLSLDDFGTGYSSLSYLQKMPMSQIKIDRSFVQAALDDKRSNKLVTGIIKIGLDLNLRVLVEGIETTEQFNAFKSNGCTEFQGYLWGCPMPLNDFIKQLPYFHK